MADGEIERERAYAAEVRRALEAMVNAARNLVTAAEQTSAAADRFSLESLGRLLKSEAEQLAELPEWAPFFGRLDFGSGPEAGDHGGQQYYIGRMRIAGGPERPPLVVDWRAPVARAFYRASAREPQGVALRRRFGWDQPEDGVAARLTGFEDEHLAHGQELGDASRIVGAEIERPRQGPMRDIVATIRPEQDDLVRADLAASICVQGAPGTGKTAVGLHRAAWLLYTHRSQLERSGVLIVGPNPTFLRYISAVLPTLGESKVEQVTLAGLLDGVPIRSYDSAEAAVVKHDERMAEVLRRALYARITEPAETLVVPDGAYRWRIPADELRAIVEGVRADQVPYETGRERVRSRVVARLIRMAERRGQTATGGWQQKIGRSRAVAGFLEATWPRVRPDHVVAEVLGDPVVLEGAADGLLTEEEQRAIRRPHRRTPKTAPWTPADAVLVDEAAALIEGTRSWGQVVVDEAQDLSPMECRVIARRSAYGSITVLGDLAQGTTPWAARDWSRQLAHLGAPEARIVALTEGFRVPGSVLDLANRLLKAMDVDVPPARPVRRDGELRVRRVRDLRAGVAETVRDALTQEGSIAVIAAADALPELADALRDTGIEAGTPDGPARVALVPAGLAKGLEYDHVVAVEPAGIVEAEPRGLHRLYVVLTRAVSRLDIVHLRPLPAALN